MIYKDGTWYVGYENPGSYLYAGSQAQGFTLNPTNIYSDTGSQSLLGTAEPIDLTGYDTLHFVAKAISQTAAGSILSSKNATFQTGVEINVIGQSVDYSADISSINESKYIGMWSIIGSSVEIYEIYLDKND